MIDGYPVFDAHVHVFPDRIAEETLRHLQSKCGVPPSFDGTRSGLDAYMATVGIDGALNCPIATRPDQVDSINRWAVTNNRHPIYSLGTIHPDSEDKPKILSGLIDNGVKGIKIHPEYQEFALADSRMSPVWEFAAASGMAVLCHCGRDAGFPPPPKAPPEAVAQLIRQYPDLLFVAAHFGGWRMWDEVELRLIGKPVFLDLAFTIGLLDDKSLVSMVRRHGVERVLFATDAPWQDPATVLRSFLRLPFEEFEKRSILFANAAQLFGFAKRNVTNEQGTST
jgi:hypothetical protein